VRTLHIAFDYETIDESLTHIRDVGLRTACEQILKDNRKLFETAQGSTYNHQAWVGGYVDHITDGLNYGRHLYEFDKAFGRPMPFELDDFILIFFLHDLEKPWRIKVKNGEVSNAEGLQTKEAFRRFREQKLREYGIVLSDYQMNALTYVEGEYKDYSSKRRVMNELGSFCHRVDTWSAREKYGYPKRRGEDEWVGADRFRTA
jgi:hypothetical protein